jgi:hypothetical protein
MSLGEVRHLEGGGMKLRRHGVSGQNVSSGALSRSSPTSDFSFQRISADVA